MFFSGFHPGEDWGTSGGRPEPSADIVERHRMNIRKIGAAATFAAGAAFALAPLASADTPITSTVESEIASLNSLFDSQVVLSGFPATDITTNAAGFDIVPLADAPQATVPSDLTVLDYFLYGVDPIKAGIASDPGSYLLFNGALGKFDDAYNVLLYSALNNGAIDPNDADFIGSASSIDHAQSLGSATEAATYFFNFGVGDLEGYFGIFPSAGTAAVSTLDISSTLTSEVNALNSLFASDVAAAGINADKIIDGTGPLPFDTILPADTNSTFDLLVFGLNPDNVSPDPGAYDVFNGALTEFANAYNVGLVSLLDPSNTFPIADIFGTHADFLADGSTAAIGEFLNLGFQDLLGYFDPTNLLGAM
jgi:hypothetical protein